VKDFYDWDKTAIAFRYSDNRNGVIPKLPDYPIDLDNVKSVIPLQGRQVHEMFWP
jgi:hypothetical protein